MRQHVLHGCIIASSLLNAITSEYDVLIVHDTHTGTVELLLGSMHPLAMRLRVSTTIDWFFEKLKAEFPDMGWQAIVSQARYKTMQQVTDAGVKSLTKWLETQTYEAATFVSTVAGGL